MSRATILIGHRGARLRAPENTLASLRRALDDGAEGLEFDVRVTRDGVPVLLHDETLDRTTDGSGPLSSRDRESLRSLDAGSHFSPDFAGEPLPELAEVLDEFLGRVPLAMELKEPLPPSELRAIGERVRAIEEPRLLIASFRPEALAPAKEQLTSTPRALILRRGQSPPDSEVRGELGLWGIFSHAADAGESLVEWCRERGLRLFVYTVNEPERAAVLSRWGIDAIISDDPGALVSTLGG